MGSELQLGSGGRNEGAGNTDFKISRWRSEQVNIKVRNETLFSYDYFDGGDKGMVFKSGVNLIMRSPNNTKLTITANDDQTLSVNGNPIGGSSSVFESNSFSDTAGDTLTEEIGNRVGATMGTLDIASGSRYGQTISVGGNGNNTMMQISGRTTGLWYRNGSYEWADPSITTWGDWYKVITENDLATVATTGSYNDLSNKIMTTSDINDANDITTTHVGFNLGTTNFPAGVQYGQTFTFGGNGDTNAQIAFGYSTDDIMYFRVGNPRRPDLTGTWNNWVRVASREYVDAQVASVSVGTTPWTEDLNATVNATAGSKTFVDTSTQVVTVVLPATPVMGDEVRIVDANGNAATNNITVQTASCSLSAMP